MNTERESMGMLRIRIQTKDKLRKLGLYGDTYDLIIDRLASEALRAKAGRRDCKDDLC